LITGSWKEERRVRKEEILLERYETSDWWNKCYHISRTIHNNVLDVSKLLRLYFRPCYKKSGKVVRSCICKLAFLIYMKKYI
jgi:hypothetical protein